MTARALLTYADYAAIPDDGRRYELHDGALVMTPVPGTSHQQVLRDLLGILHRHVSTHGLGMVLPSPVDCILSDTNVVQPDLVFVATERAAIVTERAIEGPPSLVVEIASSSSRRPIAPRKRRSAAVRGPRPRAGVHLRRPSDMTTASPPAPPTATEVKAVRA